MLMMQKLTGTASDLGQALVALRAQPPNSNVRYHQVCMVLTHDGAPSLPSLQTMGSMIGGICKQTFDLACCPNHNSFS